MRFIIELEENQLMLLFSQNGGEYYEYDSFNDINQYYYADEIELDQFEIIQQSIYDTTDEYLIITLDSLQDIGLVGTCQNPGSSTIQ